MSKFFSSHILKKVFAASLIFHLGNALKLAADDAPAPDEASGKVYACKPGPWGDLFYYYIYLEAPEDFVDHFPTPNTMTKWSFPRATEADLRELFTKATLGPALQDYLLDPKRRVSEGNMLTVFPPIPDVEALTQEQRGIIYQELAKWDVNEFYQNPVLITSGNVEDWLKGSSLRRELIDIVKGLTYYRGSVLAFSDVSAVLNYAQSDAEARDFIRTLTRTRTMVLRLEIKKDADLHGIASYWTGHKRFKAIEPILNSVAETEEVAVLDVVHLLPSMARRYLYTYPPLELAVLGRMPDCHWTSLNFFNHWPKQYFLDTRLAADSVLQNYDKISPPYEFGDVLMFLDAEFGSAIHSCVYLADDIVFTKNGENLVSPWVLMKLAEVKKVYFPLSVGSIQGFRLKAKAKS